MINWMKETLAGVIAEWPAFLFCVAVLNAVMYFGLRTIN
jgi:hypothetical protein